MQEDIIDLKALLACRAEVFIIPRRHGKSIIFGDLTAEEFALRKGYAKDYEKYIHAVFFDHLNENVFKNTKARIYDEIRKSYYSQDKEPYFESLDYYEDCRYLQEEKLEKQYGERMSRENKQKMITRKMRRSK